MPGPRILATRPGLSAMGTRGPRWLAGVWGQRMPPGPGECSPHLAHRASSGGCHDRLPRSCESWGSSSGWQRGGCRQSLSAPTSSKSSACSAFRRLGLCQMTMYEPVFTRRVLLHAEEVAIANAERGSIPVDADPLTRGAGLAGGEARVQTHALNSQCLPARSLSQTAIMMRNRPAGPALAGRQRRADGSVWLSSRSVPAGPRPGGSGGR